MVRFRLGSVVAAALTVALGLTACGGSEPEPGSGDQTTSAPSAPPEETSTDNEKGEPADSPSEQEPSEQEASPAASQGSGEGEAQPSQEVPMRDDGTIDPAKFEDLIYSQEPPRTLAQLQEVRNRETDEVISRYESFHYIDEGVATHLFGEAVADDGTRTLAYYGEYDIPTKEYTYWQYKDGGWAAPQKLPTPTGLLETDAAQPITSVEPEGDDGLEERRFRIKYEPLPEELGGAESSVLEAVITYDDQWQPIHSRYDVVDTPYYTTIEQISRNEPIEFPQPPEGASLKPADGITIKE